MPRYACARWTGAAASIGALLVGAVAVADEQLDKQWTEKLLSDLQQSPSVAGDEGLSATLAAPVAIGGEKVGVRLRLRHYKHNKCRSYRIARSNDRSADYADLYGRPTR